MKRVTQREHPLTFTPLPKFCGNWVPVSFTPRLGCSMFGCLLSGCRVGRVKRPYCLTTCSNALRFTNQAIGSPCASLRTSLGHGSLQSRIIRFTLNRCTENFARLPLG